jgi:acetyl-CoA C-acetyltransferase
MMASGVSNERDVVIVGAARTPIGKFGGALASIPAHELGAVAVRGALARATVDAREVEEVVFGQVGQVGSDAYNARCVAITAGIPVTSTAMNVNRLCGSGLQAIVTATHSIRNGDATTVVAGGNESMSGQPFLLYGERVGFRLGNRTAVDGTMSLVTDPFGGYPMGETAEQVADRFGVDRTAQDEFALLSQQRAGEAIKAGRFRGQIEPVSVSSRGGAVVVDTDEHPRPDVTREDLAKLRPAFRENGTVTAGNSSGLNDGAAALVLMGAEAASQRGLPARARLVASAVCGIEPGIMGYAPVAAIRKALDRAELDVEDIDVIELNEAFASQAVAVIRDSHFDDSKVNPNGGAIALGHPVGATGAILTVKLLAELERTGGRYGLVTMCIGGGQGIAAVFERLTGTAGDST